jgi:hypothetical protein
VGEGGEQDQPVDPALPRHEGREGCAEAQADEDDLLRARLLPQEADGPTDGIEGGIEGHGEPVRIPLPRSVEAQDRAALPGDALGEIAPPSMGHVLLEAEGPAQDDAPVAPARAEPAERIPYADRVHRLELNVDFAAGP